MSTPIPSENATSAYLAPPNQANVAYSTIAEQPPTRARAASMRPKPTAACSRSRLASREPMPMAKTITDSTTEAWVTESPIKYEARATSSSSYTSPQAAQMNTVPSTMNRAVLRRCAGGGMPQGRTDTDGSIMMGTLRHDSLTSCHPQECN